MSGTSVRRVLALGILLLGGLALVLTRPDLFFGPREDGSTWVVDIDTWRRTPYERVVTSPYDFSLDHDLSALPVTLGEWRGVDVPETNVEVFILLEPEQYVRRKYTRPDGRFVWLSLIGSRQVRSFHPTEICYISDGWTTEVASADVPLQGGTIRALEVEARKNEWTHLVLYFYVWPDKSRDLSRGVVMFKVTAPLQGDKEATLALERDFIARVFKRVVGSGAGR